MATIFSFLKWILYKLPLAQCFFIDLLLVFGENVHIYAISLGQSSISYTFIYHFWWFLGAIFILYSVSSNILKLLSGIDVWYFWLFFLLWLLCFHGIHVCFWYVVLFMSNIFRIVSGNITRDHLCWFWF